MADDLAHLALSCLPDIDDPAHALRLGLDCGLPPWLALGLTLPDGQSHDIPQIYNRPWTQAERDFVAHNLGTMELGDIARALGRTETAVVVVCKRREMSRPAARVSSGVYNSRQVARLLGVECSKSVVQWIEKGALAAENAGDLLRPYWRITRDSLLAFVASPMAAYCLQPARIADPELRTAWHRAGHPAYITLHEAACRLDTSYVILSRLVHAGQVPATRYPNWLISEDDLPAIRHPLATRPRKTRTRHFTSDEDTILIGGLALGYSPLELSHRLDRSHGSLYGRMERLQDVPPRWPVLFRPRPTGKVLALLGRPSDWPQFPIAQALASWPHPEPAGWDALRVWLRGWYWFWLHDTLPAPTQAEGLTHDLALASRHLLTYKPKTCTVQDLVERALAHLQTIGLDPFTCSWHPRWEPVRLGQHPAANYLSPCPLDNDNRVYLGDVLHGRPAMSVATNDGQP